MRGFTTRPNYAPQGIEERDREGELDRAPHNEKTVLSFFYFWNSYCKFRQNAPWLLNKLSFMKGSQGITTDVNICFINYEMIKIHVIKTNWGYSLNQNGHSKSLLLNECIYSALFIIFRGCIVLRCVRFFLIFSLNYQQRVTRYCIRIDKWEEITRSNLQTN